MYGMTEIILASLYAPWDRIKWKHFITSTISNYWFDKLLKGTQTKSSLSWFNTSLRRPDRPHHLWPVQGCDSRTRLAASYRAKMLTGSYILQSNRARFNQHEVDPTCPLCSAATEDIPTSSRSALPSSLPMTNTSQPFPTSVKVWISLFQNVKMSGVL